MYQFAERGRGNWVFPRSGSIETARFQGAVLAERSDACRDKLVYQNPKGLEIASF